MSYGIVLVSRTSPHSALYFVAARGVRQSVAVRVLRGVGLTRKSRLPYVTSWRTVSLFVVLEDVILFDGRKI